MHDAGVLPDAPTEHCDNLTRVEVAAWKPLVGRVVRWQEGQWFVDAVIIYEHGPPAGRGSVVLSRT